MSVKASISLTDQQSAFARKLVEDGRYASLSAVLQHGLELLRADRERHEAEVAAFRALIEERMKGPFIDMDESDRRIEAMIARKMREHGVQG